MSAIAVDNDGNIYFNANGNSIIKKADPQGNVTVFAGAGNLGFSNGQGTEATFNNIIALTTDSVGNVYVVDGGNHAIRKITPAGLVSTIAGVGISGFNDGIGSSAQFFYPSDIAIDKNGIIYVADAANNRIRKIEFREVPKGATKSGS